MAREFSGELRYAKCSREITPLVSIVTIAYNVSRFLPEAIESVLSQETNFRVELVIGEDCSTDNTREIALHYQKKYPDLIRVLLPEKNQGLTPNCIATHNACTGKYIALLDGDDYWTNPLKLQKQINFLESNLEFSGCAHQSEIVFDDVVGKNRLFGERKNTVYGINDTIQHRKFHTSSLVYRKEIWDKVGGIPITILSNERAIYPMLAIFGKIMYFQENMCIYRRSSIGISARITYKELEKDLYMIPWIKKIDKKFPYIRFNSFIHFCIFSYPVKVSFLPLTKHYLLFVFYSFSYFPKNLGDIKFGTIEFFKLLKKTSRHS